MFFCWLIYWKLFRNVLKKISLDIDENDGVNYDN